MKIILCGAGRVGLRIATQLTQEGNDVVVIDKMGDHIRMRTQSFDMRIITGNGADPDSLNEAKASEADMIIAVTQEDEVNMVICQVAHTLFHVPTKIARIRFQNYLKLEWQDLFGSRDLPVDIPISPEVEVGRSILRRLVTLGTFETIPFANRSIYVIGIHIKEDCSIANISLKEMRELFPDLTMRIIGIMRKGRVILPRSHDVPMIGDSIYIALDAECLMRTLNILGYVEQKIKSIIIAGGGNIGFYIAQEIEKQKKNINLKIIENNRDRAVFLANHLNESLVLHGSAIDISCLREAGIQDAQTTVMLTNDDRTNLIASVLAKRDGCQRTMALISDKTLANLSPQFGIDALIDPHATTMSLILHYVRRGRIRSLYTAFDEKAEIIEVEVLSTCSITGQTLADVEISKKMIFGAIYRNEKVIIPRGSTILKTGDRVVVFVKKEFIGDVERIFKVSHASF